MAQGLSGSSDPGALSSERVRKLEQELSAEKKTSDGLRMELHRLRQVVEAVEREIAEKIRSHEESRSISEAVTRAQTMFLSNISHDLRTPLNAILGFSEALAAGVFGDLNPRHRDYINEIYKSGVGLLSLVNEILDLSRMEAGLSRLDLAECSINEVVGSIGYVFREKARKHSIDVRIAVDGDLDFFEVDAQKVKQVLINLMTSIFVYAPDGSRILVSASKSLDPLVPAAGEGGRSERLSGEFIEIAVEDSGPVIPPDERTVLFEPFGSREPAHYRKYDGPGLSLVVCRKIADIHKGRIWVEGSSPADGGAIQSGGNRFIFLVPRYPAGAG